MCVFCVHGGLSIHFVCVSCMFMKGYNVLLVNFLLNSNVPGSTLGWRGKSTPQLNFFLVEGSFFLWAMTLGRLMVPKIDINLPRTYEKLHCKEALSVQKN